VPWIKIPEGVPAFEEGYNFEAVWPAEVYARFQKFFQIARDIPSDPTE
jgi:hypothetical protein